VSNEQGNQHPHFVQNVKAVNGNAGVVISMDPSGTEKHSMLGMFTNKREQFGSNLKRQLKR
jgi:hypothetical protein